MAAGVLGGQQSVEAKWDLESPGCRIALQNTLLTVVAVVVPRGEEFVVVE